MWFLSLPRQLSGGFHNVFQTSSNLGHIALWFILGALLWASAPGNTNPVRTAEDQGQAPIDKLWRGDGSDQVPG